MYNRVRNRVVKLSTDISEHIQFGTEPWQNYNLKGFIICWIGEIC